MLRTLPLTRNYTETQRLIGIVVFAVLAIISAKIEIPRDPVPFTMQPFVVLLAGMVLGARDGALSLGLYVGLIALGFPFDANGRGTAALFGPTGGYLMGFVIAAWAVGWLVENGDTRFWQRLSTGLFTIAIVYLFGAYVLKNVTGDNGQTVWSIIGDEPFLYGGYLICIGIAVWVIWRSIVHGDTRFWQPLGAGVVGIAVIYIFGIYVLKNVTGNNWQTAWEIGGEPFLGLDLIKAIIAAGLAESTRKLLLRSLTPPEIQ
jgi:biotin transport system substrate-specific component